ncbi:hypothetical protein V1264_018337 [Littorina saxatilis]|uniref:Fanconi anemia group M protein n=1 Tax=Littorina saxatilis TaxID=31220 RepID=A0AAN9GCQ0_9CAEN
MSKPKQATLFQSWGGKTQSQNNANKNRTGSATGWQNPKSANSDHHDTISLLDDEDEEDQELARALEESLACHQNKTNNAAGASTSAEPVAHTSSVRDEECNELNISLGIEEQDIDHGIDRNNCLSQWKTSDLPVGELAGFDPSSGQLWIYPTNYPVREYQFNIVQKALVKNTLVTLPTGLGKTFIAAVIMYNFYRWYPEGKVVFMAPTKPLVAQQIEACYNIMGIPCEDTAEMTGSMNPTDRQKAWRDRRVFFLTPQVMTNDMSRGTCAAEVIKCVVVDEAHKALGNHAYCQVIRELMKYNQQFRVLALSATPGSDIKSVQNVISNLAISHIELRSEESPDIKPYTHERVVDKIVVPLGDELVRIKNQYIQVLSVVVRRLVHQRVLYNREVTSLSKFLILKAREAFRQNPPESLPRNQYGIVEGDFALAMSLYHGYELLQLHGLRSLFNFLNGIISGDKSYGRTRSELMKNADFTEIMNILREKFQPSDASNSQNKPAFLVGHPKMVKLETVVLEHFRKFEAEGQATRVMIFSQYRDSVHEITAMLQQHEPQVKVMSFIGQSSVGKATKGLTQKEQLKVMQGFRTGGYNVLVSTCVGEEGLDIGDVDLIICFDAHKSPIRLVQRMGRTGRKRQGRIVMLVTEGKEEQIYNHSQYTKRSIHRAIMNGARSLVFYANNPRMIPADVTPACHRMHITVQQQRQPAGKQKDTKQMGKRDGKMHKLLSKAKSDSRKSLQEEAGISLEEFIELKSLGSAVTVKHLPAPRMQTLESRSAAGDQDVQNEKDSTELNLSEWVPWQNTLQQTSVFGHSRRSKHLVELLEFTDLQQMLPPGEDNYGDEMKLYLDMDDVFSDNRRPISSNIAQFVVPSPRNQSAGGLGAVMEKRKQEDITKEGKGKTSKVAVKRKRKHHLPTIEVEEGSDDSDFLPEVDFFVASTSKCVSPAVGKSVVTTDTRPSTASPGTRAASVTDRTSSSRPNGGDFLAKKQSPAVRLQSKRLDSMSADANINDVNTTEDFSFHDIDDNESGFAERTLSDTSTNVFRLPTPPRIEDIPRLLSGIEPDDVKSADVSSIVSRCNIPFQMYFTHHSHMQEPLLPELELSGPDNREPEREISCDPRAENMLTDKDDSFSDSHAQLCPVVSGSAVRKNDKKQTTEEMTMKNNPVVDDSSSLSDSDFDAIEQKILQRKATAKTQRTKDGTKSALNIHGVSHAEGNEVDTCNAESTEVPESDTAVFQPPPLSQAELKFKKPLFKPGDSDTADLNFPFSSVLPSADTEINNVKQKSSFVYSFSQGSSQAPVSSKASSPEQEFSTERARSIPRTSHDFHTDTAAEEKKITSVKENRNKDGNKTTVPNDWMTGKQLLHCEMDKKKSSEVTHKSFQETSLSDSFLQKNFVDNDEDDADFEVVEPSPIKPSKLLTGKLKNQSHSIFRGDEFTRKSISPKPGVPSSRLSESLKLPVVTSTEKSPVSEKEHSNRNESLYTFTQAMNVVHSHPSSDSQKDSMEVVPPNDKSLDENFTEVATGQLKDNDVCVQEKNDQLAVEEEPEEFGNFDLGFDFDEDIIPPSPEADAPLSFLSGRSMIAKPPVFSVNRERVGSADVGMENIPEADDFDNDEVLLAVVEGDIDEDSPCFSSSFQSKPVPTFGLNSSPETEATAKDVQRLVRAAQPESETDNLPKIGKPKLSLGSRGKLEQPSSSSHIHKQHKIKNTHLNADFNKLHQSSSQGFQCLEVSKTGSGDRKLSVVQRTSHSSTSEKKDSSSRYSDRETSSRSHKPQLKLSSIGTQEDTHFQILDSFSEKPTSKGHVKLSSIGSSHPQEDVEFDGLGGLSADFDDDFESELEETDATAGLTKTPVAPQNFDLNADFEDDFESEFADTHTSAAPPKTPVAPRKCHLNADFEDDFEAEFADPNSSALTKTPIAPKKFATGVYCSTPVSAKKRKSFTFASSSASKFSKEMQSMKNKVQGFSLVHEDDPFTDDGGDFEESIIARKKPRAGQLQTSDDSDMTTNADNCFKAPSKNKEKPKKRKRGCAFLDNEAEESDDVDVSSDEADDDLEMMEGSFIDNCTQMTQASQIDMQAVYMKSVRSPGHRGGKHGGRFRLQYNHNAINVYSQLPNHEEEDSQYQEDSFCVGSDEEGKMWCLNQV